MRQKILHFDENEKFRRPQHFVRSFCVKFSSPEQIFQMKSSNLIRENVTLQVHLAVAYREIKVK